jgi:hypothetical protein
MRSRSEGIRACERDHWTANSEETAARGRQHRLARERKTFCGGEMQGEGRTWTEVS